MFKTQHISCFKILEVMSIIQEKNMSFNVGLYIASIFVN